MKTELRDRLSSLEAEVAKLKADIGAESDPQMPWFYPEIGDDYWVVAPSADGGGYYTGGYKRHGFEKAPYQYPAIRTKEQAEIIAQARSEADRWRSMGVMPKDGEDRWIVTPNGWVGYAAAIGIQRVADAVFASEEKAKEALKKFGGIEQLQKMRRGLWGDV